MPAALGDRGDDLVRQELRRHVLARGDVGLRRGSRRRPLRQPARRAWGACTASGGPRRRAALAAAFFAAGAGFATGVALTAAGFAAAGFALAAAVALATGAWRQRAWQPAGLAAGGLAAGGRLGSGRLAPRSSSQQQRPWRGAGRRAFEVAAFAVAALADAAFVVAAAFVAAAALARAARVPAAGAADFLPAEREVDTDEVGVDPSAMVESVPVCCAFPWRCVGTLLGLLLSRPARGSASRGEGGSSALDGLRSLDEEVALVERTHAPDFRWTAFHTHSWGEERDPCKHAVTSS